MKIQLATLTTWLVSIVALASTTQIENRYQFAPPNDRRIPVSQNFSGITEDQFNEVLDIVDKVYQPVFEKQNAKLVIDRHWTDETVNAFAYRVSDEWHIAMYGGLARHAEVTIDGFMLVACHEIGHHLGGFPRMGWASNEGNSDYFGTLKCLRRIWNSQQSNSIDVVAKMAVDPAAAALCEKQWEKEEDQAVCKRAAMAGKGLARLLADLGREKMPEFDTPDKSVVTKTKHSHPKAQCRLDTYFHGALCTAEWTEDISETDPDGGVCKFGKIGGRPACWFRPPEEKDRFYQEGL